MSISLLVNAAPPAEAFTLSSHQISHAAFYDMQAIPAVALNFRALKTIDPLRAAKFIAGVAVIALTWKHAPWITSVTGSLKAAAGLLMVDQTFGPLAAVITIGLGLLPWVIWTVIKAWQKNHLKTAQRNRRGRTRRTFLKAFAGAAAVVSLTKSSEAQDTNSSASRPLAPFRAEIRQTIRAQVNRASVLADASALVDDRVRQRIQKAVDDLLKDDVEIWATDRSADDVIDRVWRQLERDLFPMGVVSIVDTVNGSFLTSYYELRSSPSPQQYTRRNAPKALKETTVYSVYPAKGNARLPRAEGFFLAALPNKIFLIDSEIEEAAQRTWLLLHPDGPIHIVDHYVDEQGHDVNRTLDWKDLYGTDRTVVREILNETLQPLSFQDMVQLERAEVQLHEELHMDFEALRDKLKKGDLYRDADHRTEFASYLGTLARGRFPYVQLLEAVRLLKQPYASYEHRTSAAVFRGLVRHFQKRLLKTSIALQVPSLMQNDSVFSPDYALDVIEALRAAGITDQEIQKAANTLYRKEFGIRLLDALAPLVAVFKKPLAVYRQRLFKVAA